MSRIADNPVNPKDANMIKSKPDQMSEARALVERLTGYTPGPWRIVVDDDGNPLSGRPSVCAGEGMDCGIVHWDGFVQPFWRSARGDKEIHANARLIAAAPELHAALAAALDRADRAEAQIAEAEARGREAGLREAATMVATSTTTNHHQSNCILALIDAPAPAKPRYPTPEMMDAGLYHCMADMDWGDLFTAWQAMFDAVTLDGGTTDLAPAARTKVSVQEAAKVMLGACPNPLFDILKPVMSGEFLHEVCCMDENGDEYIVQENIEWANIKDIIRAALRAIAGEDQV